MRTKVRTTPELAPNTTPDYRSWERNVADKFKDKSEEEIKETLSSTANPFAVCMENWDNDFNFGTLVRNANAFNAKEVFYLGDKRWDKRSAVGVYNYTPVQWLPTIDDFKKLRERYVIVGIDNVPGSVSLYHHNWRQNSLLVFGSEGTGLTPEIQKMCSAILHIDMYGSVRSFNAGVASGIAMYDLVEKLNHKYSDSMWDE
jgi:tRNA G18 (ribose-2'-O)-methylase SpoU